MASLSFLGTMQSPLQHSYQPRVVVPIAPQRKFFVSCEQGHISNNKSETSHGGDDNGSPTRLPHLDRRNVLLGGLGGGLYSAASIGLLGGGQQLAAIGAPIALPDLTKCHAATSEGNKVECCPPYTDISSVTDYRFPSSSKPLRVRKPAHRLDNEEVVKYKEAVRLMKGLPEDDPRSFKQQANVHCQHCNGAYYQLGTTKALQVHYNWLLLPWHRFYLHFYERILGSLIGDDNFAIPFWNWDSPDGMTMPSCFVNDKSSPLYDANRNISHFPPALLDYEYSYSESTTKAAEVEDVIHKNLLKIQKAYAEGLNAPTLFMGGILRAGEELNSPGSLETVHNAAHTWSGPDESPHMDMGNFYSAGRDPMFFSHHSNVDRMWDIYRRMRGNKTDFNDSDWLDSAFLFVDEKKQLVKVKVRDSLDTLKLRYIYENVKLPWLDKDIRKKVLKAKSKITKTALPAAVEFGSSPRSLSTTLRVSISRPKKSRTKAEKEKAVEVLVIYGIKTPIDKPSAFDVYVVTSKEATDGYDLGELAGSFLQVPHHVPTTEGETKMHESKLKLGITSLLEDINAEDDDEVVVSLVPRFADISIGGIKIEHLDTDVGSN